MSEFSDLLRRARIAAGLSQSELAARARVGEDSIESYEIDRRKPRRHQVIELCDALELDDTATNEWLRSLSYEPIPAGRLRPFLERHKPLGILREECRSYSWPCLINSENFEIVGWNDAANDIAELDFATDLAEPGARHLLRIAALDHFRERLINWDEPISYMLSIFKADRITPFDPGSGAAFFNALILYMAQHHSDVLARVYKLWEQAAPWREGPRIRFPVA